MLGRVLVNVRVSDLSENGLLGVEVVLQEARDVVKDNVHSVQPFAVRSYVQGVHQITDVPMLGVENVNPYLNRFVPYNSRKHLATFRGIHSKNTFKGEGRRAGPTAPDYMKRVFSAYPSAETERDIRAFLPAATEQSPSPTTSEALAHLGRAEMDLNAEQYKEPYAGVRSVVPTGFLSSAFAPA